MKILQLLIDRKDDLIKIAEHYGEKNQLNKLAEELTELDSEIMSSVNYGTGEITSPIQEEAADVFIMLTQIAYLISNTPADVMADIAGYKIDRQLKRIGVQK